MASKSFKNTNPALSFITVPEEENNTELVRDPERNTTKKAPEGYRLNPEYIEVKSKRVQLLLQPSTVEAIKALAKKNGLSMNEAINEAIQEYLQRH